MLVNCLLIQQHQQAQRMSAGKHPKAAMGMQPRGLSDDEEDEDDDDDDLDDDDDDDSDGQSKIDGFVFN